MKFHFNFDWICSDIEYELSMIEDFFNNYHLNLPDMKKKAEDEINRYLSKYDDDEEYQANASSLYGDHYLKYEELFPNQINAMLIIMLYTFLERNIKKICDDYTKRNELPFSIEGFEGDLGSKLMRFVKCYKPDAYTASDIQTIKELAMIRNQIVHNNGYITNKEKKIRSFIADKEKSNNSISIENNCIIIRKPFCDEYKDKVKKTMRNIFSKFNYRTNYTISRVE